MGSVGCSTAVAPPLCGIVSGGLELTSVPPQTPATVPVPEMDLFLVRQSEMGMASEHLVQPCRAGLLRTDAQERNLCLELVSVVGRYKGSGRYRTLLFLFGCTCCSSCCFVPSSLWWFAFGVLVLGAVVVAGAAVAVDWDGSVACERK